jgi:small subunit ribosomal protein S2
MVAPSLASGGCDASFMETVTVKQLIEAGVHFGCRVSRWNPKMAPYIYGRRNLIHIMDLRETLRGLLRAQNFLFHVAAEGQQILWVGTKRQVKGVIHDSGQRTGMPVVTERWIGGTLTNFSVIRSRLRRLEELERMEEDGTFATHSKKMVSTLRRERRKIERNLGGIREMSQIPGAMVVVDPAREENAVKEARRLGVPVVGILDTDCDPTLVDIVIPGNDDALKSVRLLIDRLATSVEEGSANRREQVAAVGQTDKAAEGAAPSDEPRPTRTQRASDLRPRPPSRPSASAAASEESDPANSALAAGLAGAEEAGA